MGMMKNSMLAAGLTLTWNIGALYTRQNDKRQIDTERRLNDVERETFLFNTTLATTQSNGAIEAIENDTVQLYLKAKQLGATRNAYADQRADTEKQIAALRQQLAKAEEDKARYETLVSDGAANRKLLDDATSTVNVLRRQLQAQLSSLDNSTRSLTSQMTATDIQWWQVIDQLEKCHVKSPISGTMIEKYAERGEFATVGRPLFKIADTSKMFLRAYITTAQLQHVKIGQKVKVFADYGDGNRKEYAGMVAWISSRSEFTPKTVLTDDERADLVYAVKIAVKNDSYLKIGMYGETIFLVMSYKL